jgi:hypothetical protein
VERVVATTTTYWMMDDLLLPNPPHYSILLALVFANTKVDTENNVSTVMQKRRPVLIDLCQMQDFEAFYQ